MTELRPTVTSSPSREQEITFDVWDYPQRAPNAFGVVSNTRIGSLTRVEPVSGQNVACNLNYLCSLRVDKPARCREMRRGFYALWALLTESIRSCEWWGEI